MRFIIMHKTNAHWEVGRDPEPGVDRACRGRCSASWRRPACSSARKVFAPARKACGSGLRRARAPSSRVPSKASNELPAGFSILRARSLDEAIEWASRQADGAGRRARSTSVPSPSRGTSAWIAEPAERHHAALHGAAKGHRRDGGWRYAAAAQRAELARLIEETARSGVHLVTETMRPSGRGRRYKNSRNGVSVFDGPFTETKELIGGYVIVSAASLEEAGAMGGARTWTRSKPTK